MEDSKTQNCKWTDCSAGELDSCKKLYDHYVEIHLMPQQTLDTLKCQWKNCQYQAANLSSLRSHGLRHIPYRQYACQQCGRTFKWKHDRNKHFARLHTKQQPSPMMSMYSNMSPMANLYMNQMGQQYQQYSTPDYRTTSPSPNLTQYQSPQQGFQAPQLGMFDFMARGVDLAKSTSTPASPNLLEMPPPEDDLINFTAF
eukprot:NODE_644_length_5057_cov_0.295079.p3 type:complete len:199 gc:universal NODE_644_length_5057_cov_0.295079:646-1242(+)